MKKSKKTICKIEEMAVRKYTRTDNNKQVIKCENETTINLDAIMFEKNIISHIEIFKAVFDGNDSSIFVKLYLGNIEVCTSIYKSDVLLEIEYDKTINGEEHVTGYYIRKVRDYDKEEVLK